MAGVTEAQAKALGHGIPLVELADAARQLAQIRQEVDLPSVLEWGPLRLDLKKHEARWDGAVVSFTRQQFKFVSVLVLAEGAAVTFGQLSRLVWGEELTHRGDVERVVALVRRIRKKIEVDPTHPAFLVSVPGVGYRLADPKDLPGPRGTN